MKADLKNQGMTVEQKENDGSLNVNIGGSVGVEEGIEDEQFDKPSADVISEGTFSDVILSEDNKLEDETLF